MVIFRGFLFVGILTLCSFRQGCLQMDLMLIGDFSASVHGNEQFISDAFKSFAQKLTVSEDGVRIGVIAFNNEAFLISPLNSDPQDLNSRIVSLRSFDATGTTNLNSALYMATESLTKSRDIRKMIIIVSDGDVDSNGQVYAIASQLKAIGIGICTVLIKNASSKEEFMKAISSDCYVESDYETLGEELQKLSICL